MMDHESDVDMNCNWCAQNCPQSFGEMSGRGGNWRTSRDHSNYSIFKVGQNTEKSHGDLSKLSIIQTPVKDQHWCEKLVRNIISNRIITIVMEIWGDLLSLRLQWKTTIWLWWEKNFHKSRLTGDASNSNIKSNLTTSRKITEKKF